MTGAGAAEDPRRRTPRTDAVLADPAVAAAAERLGRARTKAVVTAVLDACRRGEVAPEDVVGAVRDALPAGASSLRPVINATGVVVHTNLGRAPLSAAAVEALAAAAGTTDVELDLATGSRGRRGAGALAALAAAVPDAGDVHVVNNGAAALALATSALAHVADGPGREVVVARGEMVEIGDGFRVPDLVESAGARLREVGTTNRVHARDYADALGERTAFVLKVHPSNFRVEGFTSSVAVDELATLAAARGVPLVVDIGSGLLAPHPRLPEEPDAATVLRAGADLVTASGDKLLGGPQAGLLLGRAELVHRLRRHPLARALRVDKLTLAALEATLSGPATPVATALDAEPGELLARAERLAAAINAAIDSAVNPAVAAAPEPAQEPASGAPRRRSAEAVRSQAAVGGGGAPGVVLPSAAVALDARLAGPLRAGRVPVLGRVHEGRLLLDLVAVPAEQDDALLAAVLAALGAAGPDLPGAVPGAGRPTDGTR
ncbi:L-seryl-tRNA(Sec) selenium transferase [Nocardioides panaciterrulae]|uniref:L-seryl-tRNA(Sec) selenium transferase n=1 Tax=Nocardioides panaciterrulae TaxID=661492 RepID=A0A7Y9E5F6_9ACTN|nr:L-seryl-tRNA(Ser) seleniumtransferase [Nocardioides panaciterrulae]